MLRFFCLSSLAMCLLCASPAAPVQGQGQDGRATATSPTNAGTATVVVTVKNLKERKGQLLVGVFNSDATFLRNEKAFRTQFRVLTTLDATAPIDALTLTFDALPPGEYAVGVHHDKNGNGKLDKNLFGAPKEPAGVSNNVRPRMRFPRYNEAKFTVAAKENKALVIELR